jgi:hypothetical protein
MSPEEDFVSMFEASVKAKWFETGDTEGTIAGWGLRERSSTRRQGRSHD